MRLSCHAGPIGGAYRGHPAHPGNGEAPCPEARAITWGFGMAMPTGAERQSRKLHRGNSTLPTLTLTAPQRVERRILRWLRGEAALHPFPLSARPLPATLRSGRSTNPDPQPFGHLCLRHFVPVWADARSENSANESYDPCIRHRQFDVSYRVALCRLRSNRLRSGRT